MSDLDERLTGALTRAATDAPAAHGLAERARSRRRRRTRSRGAIGVTAVAAVTAAVIAGAPAVLSTSDDGGHAEPAGGDDGDWHTITMSVEGDAILAELPAGWGALDTADCRFPVTAYGPEGTDPCAVPQPLVVRGSANADFADLPGTLHHDDEWSGYVLSGQAALMASDPERATVRRILASARVEGEDQVDVSAWTVARPPTRDVHGQGDVITATLPTGADVEIKVHPGYPDCDPGRTPARRDRTLWTASLCRDRIVTVTAPTQALTDIVAASVRGY